MGLEMYLKLFGTNGLNILKKEVILKSILSVDLTIIFGGIETKLIG
jgi:hypothetical protein